MLALSYYENHVLIILSQVYYWLYICTKHHYYTLHTGDKVIAIIGEGKFGKREEFFSAWSGAPASIFWGRKDTYEEKVTVVPFHTNGDLKEAAKEDLKTSFANLVTEETEEECMKCHEIGIEDSRLKLSPLQPKDPKKHLHFFTSQMQPRAHSLTSANYHELSKLESTSTINQWLYSTRVTWAATSTPSSTLTASGWNTMELITASRMNSSALRGQETLQMMIGEQTASYTQSIPTRLKMILLCT